MDTIKYALNQYESVMDNETVGVQVGCYSVALLGLTVALRKVRPFSRFKKPYQIPNSFIQERRLLTGKVKRIDPNGALLMIEHKPLISLPIIPKGELPVKLLGVKVSGLGVSWLQTITAEQNVQFIPIKKDKEFLHCEVLLPNNKKGIRKPIRLNRKESLLRLFSKKEPLFIDVGQSLVKIGFAELDPSQDMLLKNAQNLSYLNKLNVAETYALKKKLGTKYYLNSAIQMLFIHGNRALHIFIYYIKEIGSRLFKLPKVIMS